MARGRARIDIESRYDAKGTQDAERALGRLNQTGSRALGALKGAALATGVAAGVGLAASIRTGIDEMLEQEKASARTANVLKTTGGVANVTAKQVEGLASALQRTTGTADDVIQSGANMLLTFKQIRNEVGAGNDIFNQAVAITNDLSVAMGTDMEKASIQVGKALNDPIRGVTALQRIGVTFNEQQREQIKAMVESGRTMDAQKIILAELKTQFEGAASAEGETTEAVQRAQRQWEDFSEGLMVAVMPALQAVAGILSELAAFLARHTTAVKVAIVALTALAAAYAVVRVAAAAQAVVLATVAAATRAATVAQWLLNAALTANPIGVVVVALAALAAGLIFAYRHSERFRAIVDGALGAVVSAGKSVLEFFRGNWKTIAVLISGPFAPIAALATDAFGVRSKLVRAFREIIGFLRNLPSRLRDLGLEMGKALARGVLDGIGDLGRNIGNTLLPGNPFGSGGAATLPAGAYTFRGGGGGGGVAGGLFRARGGDVPGPHGAPVPIIAHAGEVVLNPAQQRIIGIDRIMQTLRMTGAAVGGDRFAGGGIVGGAVQAASAFAKSQVGEPYVWGGGHSFGDSYGWDCSGFASNVAARVPGYTGGIGTTMTLYPKARAEGAASSSSPIAFGFNGMSVNDPRRQHMGVRVNGVWYDAGSGGVQTGRTRWDSGVWIPPGLGGLSSTGVGSGGGPDPGPGVTPDRPIGSKRIAAFLKAVTGSLRAGPPMTPSERATERISGRHADDTLQDRRVGGAARSAAQAGGVSNTEKLDAIAEKAVLDARRAELLADSKDITRAAARVDGQLRKKRGTLRKLYQQLRKARTRSRQNALIAAINQVREDINDLVTEKRALAREAAGIANDAALVDLDISAAMQLIGSLPDTAPAESGGVGDTNPSPDQQAQLDQANARALAAQQNAAGSEAFLKTLRESASIDPGQGGRPIIINVEGSLVRYGELAAFVTGALGTQGAPVPGAFASAS